MDIDDYENLNESFKIVDSNIGRYNFYTTDEMDSDTTIKKENVSHDEIVGDPTQQMKSIKTNRNASYDIHTAISSTNGSRVVKNSQTLPSHSFQQRQHPPQHPPQHQSLQNKSPCPICSEISIQVCNCQFRDSMCKNKHKWHFREGKILLGNTH